VKSQWRKVQELLQNEEAFSQLAKIDRLTVFEDYIKDLDRKENEEKQLEKMQIRRQERKNRTAFGELLNELTAKDLINVRTRWKNLFPLIKDDPRYLAIINQTGRSTPRDLFDDKIEELETQFDEEKRKVKNFIKEKGFSFTTKTTFEEFLQFFGSNVKIDTFNSAANNSTTSTAMTSTASSSTFMDTSTITQTITLPGSTQPINIKVLYEEFVDRATSKEKNEDKKKRKTFDSFKELLKSLKQITPATQLSEIVPLVQEHDTYKVLTDEERDQAFVEYLEYLQKKSEKHDKDEVPMEDSEEEGADSDSPDRKKRKRERKEKDDKKPKKHHKSSHHKKKDGTPGSDSEDDRSDKKHKKSKKSKRKDSESEDDGTNKHTSKRHKKHREGDEGADNAMDDVDPLAMDQDDLDKADAAAKLEQLEKRRTEILEKLRQSDNNLT